MQAINNIKCSNFIRLVGASIKYGKFLRVSEEDKNDPDDGENEKKEENVPKLVLLLSKGGSELENFVIKTKEELITIVIQVATTMAMGKQLLEFERRDAHVSNILVGKTKEKELEYFIGGKKCFVKSNNILIKLIDFANQLVYCDDWEFDSNESNQTKEDDELHLKIYDLMNNVTGGNWKDYHPGTNVLWIRYLIQILSRFDSSGSASKDPGTQAFQEAKRRNNQRLEKKLLQRNFLMQLKIAKLQVTLY
uniref:Non-specific serine/threonine protein kinase n=1 Tax=Panagrolaimus sp. PS1159 TaxID=55785 RepID=A0AC35FI95_9BILA